MEFEKHITKFEVTNQCLLMEDLNGSQQNIGIDASKVFVAVENKIYPASLRDFYVNGKFKEGIHFDHEQGHTSEFYFDIGVSEGRRAIINYAKETHEGLPLIHVKVYLLTK